MIETERDSLREPDERRVERTDMASDSRYYAALRLDSLVTRLTLHSPFHSPRRDRGRMESVESEEWGKGWVGRKVERGKGWKGGKVTGRYVRSLIVVLLSPRCAAPRRDGGPEEQRSGEIRVGTVTTWRHLRA